MSLSTNLVSGLVSGFDWRSMIDQLMAIEHERVDLIEDRKSEYESKLSEWQSVNTMLLSLKTASEALSTEKAFKVYTASTTSNTSTSASNLLTVSTSSSASPALYNIKVNNLAQSEKISSQNYSATNTSLGLSGDGEILINGKVVKIVDTDTLADIKDKINAVNTGSNPSGVTASIVSHSSTNHHLILTSDDTGEDGLSVLEGAYSGGADILETMGFISSTTAIKNTTSDGGKSDLFTSSNGAIKTLLGLTNAPGATIVTIGGQPVSINLVSSSESLTTIASSIDTALGANGSALVVPETVDGEERYRIDISGTTSFSDNGNVLQTLGIIKGAYENVKEVHQGTVEIQDGSSVALSGTPSTLMTDLKIGGSSANVQNGDKITISGKKPDGTAITTVEFVVAVDAEHNDIGDLITHIQDAFTGSGNTVTVTFVSGKINIQADTAGDSQLEISLVCNNLNGGILDFGEISTSTEGRKMQVAAGEDAEIVVDNVTITDSSNTITDIIAGATLSLVGEDTDTTVTLKVDRDLDTIKSKITDMVNAYNSIMEYINTQFSYDDETEETGGILFGDGTLSSVKSELINTVMETIIGASSDFNRLALIGITLDLTNTEEGNYQDLTLTIDDDDLTDALESNFNDVRSLFIAYGTSPYSNLTYISHTDDTEGGAYKVTISQAATRGTTTGSKSLAGKISVAEKVTLTDFATGRVATVNLTTDMYINDVVNAINSEFATEYTEKLVGFNTNSGVTTSTLFNDANVGGDNDDTITFSGTRRNGIIVSGSYTISDATTETVGDLLEAIEDMYEDEVTVALDGSGKIVITDTQAGDSQLTFTIDTTALTTLVFGTVNTTNTGGVVGRYAMPITASNDGGKLLLTHNTYGTGQQVTTKSENGSDDLGLNDATKVWGENVAGTINSLTATGSGQRLSLDSDGNNADGLSISYTGTSAIEEADNINFTLTLGIGELLDRQLGFITDTTDGYVAYKKTSLQNSIDSFETRIEDMEAQLNLKMERMINKFVAMEVALSRIQNQSNWLSGQINASFSGWGWF